MKATTFKYDLIIGTATGSVDGEEIPDGVPLARLRYIGGAVVDVADATEFWIDDDGQKHAEQLEPEWQHLACHWDDAVVLRNGAWQLLSDLEAINAARARGRATVAAIAEMQRQKYITPGDGKSAVYSLKREEAVGWAAYVTGHGGSSPVGGYPWIRARAARLNASPESVAEEWLTKAQTWEAAGRIIENTYEAAIDAINGLANNTATIDAGIDAIIEGLTWA